MSYFDYQLNCYHKMLGFNYQLGYYRRNNFGQPCVWYASIKLKSCSKVKLYKAKLSGSVSGP